MDRGKGLMIKLWRLYSALPGVSTPGGTGPAGKVRVRIQAHEVTSKAGSHRPYQPALAPAGFNRTCSASSGPIIHA